MYTNYAKCKLIHYYEHYKVLTIRTKRFYNYYVLVNIMCLHSEKNKNYDKFKMSDNGCRIIIPYAKK